MSAVIEEKAHARLSPSAASRWLKCPPSVTLAELYPHTTSVAADEGTAAHTLSEHLIEIKLHSMAGYDEKAYFMKEREIQAKIDEAKRSKYYNQEMQSYCEEFRDFVLDRYNEALAVDKKAKIFLETKVDLSEYAPESFGRVDVHIVCRQYVEVIDLKYGKGVPVTAEYNSQMKVYAIGIVERHDWFYDFQEVRMTIYQPRIDNISSWFCTVGYLKKWANEVLVPTAKLAFAGEGDFQAGEHCRFCPANGECRTRAVSANIAMPKHPNQLTEEEIVMVLLKAPEIKSWLSDVEEYALKQAMAGVDYPGMKAVEGRSNRKYLDEEQVAERMVSEGYREDQIYAPRKLKSITDMKKTLGKSFDQVLSGLLIKPPGAPTLVPVTDPRKSLGSIAKIEQKFEGYETIE